MEADCVNFDQEVFFGMAAMPIPLLFGDCFNSMTIVLPKLFKKYLF